MNGAQRGMSRDPKKGKGKGIEKKIIFERGKEKNNYFLQEYLERVKQKRLF